MSNLLKALAIILFGVFTASSILFLTRDAATVPKVTSDIVIPKEKPITIVALGDIACAPNVPVTDKTCHQNAVLDQIKKLNPEAVLLLGDLQYEKGEARNFQAVFGPILGDLKNKSLPAPGNHEYFTKDAAGYLDFWKDSPLFEKIKQTYYSHSLGDWKILSLNSNCEFVSCSDASLQDTWLKQELSKDRPKCTLAFWHHPVFASGKYFNAITEKSRGQQFWQALQTSSTDIVLNGHDHLYERFAKQLVDGKKDDQKGIRQFTVGTGGKSHYAVTTKDKNQEVVIDNTFGFLRLDLYKHYYKWAYVDESGSVLDSGTTACSF